MAKAVRARRALEEAALRGRRRTDANADGARADAPMSDEQIAGVAACLNRHEVEYLLVGGGAAQLHGAPVMRTRDADVVPSKSDDNLDRLSAALREMNARVWVGPNEPDGLAMAFDRGTLGQIEGLRTLTTTCPSAVNAFLTKRLGRVDGLKFGLGSCEQLLDHGGEGFRRGVPHRGSSRRS